MSRSELTHQQIIDVVSANQGANSRKIADALSIFEAAKRKPFLLRLNYLVKKKLIHVRKENGANFYYTKTPPAPANIAPIATKSVASSERMKLAVIGLKPGQAHMIKNEYGRQINLSFIESDGGHGKQLGALSETCDYVIQMTKFTNHATSDHIAAFGGKLVLVGGGMTTLRDKITDLYVAWDDQRKAKAA